jgi:hypothetical protein
MPLDTFDSHPRNALVALQSIFGVILRIPPTEHSSHVP